MRRPFSVLQSRANELFPQISPGGKWLAYQSNETGRPEVYVKQFPEGPDKWQVSTDGGQFPRWRRDGKGLCFVLAAARTHACRSQQIEHEAKTVRDSLQLITRQAPQAFHEVLAKDLLHVVDVGD